MARLGVCKLSGRQLMILVIVGVLMTTLSLPNAALAATKASPTQRWGYHIVKKGETLSHIARYYGVSVGALASANSLANPNYIYNRGPDVPYSSRWTSGSCVRRTV